MQSRGPIEQQQEAVRPFATVSGLGFYARNSFMTRYAEGDETNARKRRDELIEILSIRPISIKHWLLLAEIRSAIGEGPSKVADAFGFSAITGANEGFIMGRRGLFGLSQREPLPADFRRRAVTDLVSNPTPLSTQQIDWLRQALSEKTEPV